MLPVNFSHKIASFQSLKCPVPCNSELDLRQIFSISLLPQPRLIPGPKGAGEAQLSSVFPPKTSAPPNPPTLGLGSNRAWGWRREEWEEERPYFRETVTLSGAGADPGFWWRFTMDSSYYAVSWGPWKWVRWKHWTSCAGHLFHWLLHLIWNLCCLVASPLRWGLLGNNPQAHSLTSPIWSTRSRHFCSEFNGLCTPPHPSTWLQPQPSAFNPPGYGSDTSCFGPLSFKKTDFANPFLVRFEIKWCAALGKWRR